MVLVEGRAPSHFFGVRINLHVDYTKKRQQLTANTSKLARTRVSTLVLAVALFSQNRELLIFCCVYLYILILNQILVFIYLQEQFHKISLIHLII